MLVFRYSRVSGRFEIAGTSGGTGQSRASFRPPVDISLRNGVFTVTMDIPGASPNDISIEASDYEINILGSITFDDPPGPCRLMERHSGSFVRTLSFPGRIAPDKVQAELGDGVLTLRVPSISLDRDPTRIEIRIEGAD